MGYIVTITKQGQISIPMPIRVKHGLNSFKKAIVYSDDQGKIVMEPILDLLSLKGVIKSNKKFDSKITRREFEKHLAQKERK